MIGIIIILLVSWLLLWLFNRNSLAVLGIIPSKKLIIDLLVGFIASVIASSIYFLSIIGLTKTVLTFNNQFTVIKFFNSCWWMLKSVLFEEFIFRGALLYILIQKIGIKWACILSAVAFGIYHWFSYSVLGNPVQMIFIFIITGIGGLMFAYAFAVTKSLYLPIGLHFGWNLVSVVVFSQGPLGQQLLIVDNEEKLSGAVSILFFLFQVLALPAFTYWYLSRRRTSSLEVNLRKEPA